MPAVLRAGLLPAWLACAALAAPALAAGTEPIRLNAAEGAGLVLEHWPADGWTTVRDGRDVEIRFRGLGRGLELAAGLEGALPPGIAALATRRDSEDTYLTLTLACDCELAIAGDGTSRLAIQVPGAGAPDDVDAGGAAAEAHRPASSGPAPASAPVPVPKAAPVGARRHGSIDVAEAQARLMEQLLRAADAGIVDLGPDPAAPEPTDTPAPDADARPDQAVAEANRPDAEGPAVSVEPRPQDAAAVAANIAARDPVPVTPVPAGRDASTAPQPKVQAAAEPRCFARDDLAFPEPFAEGGFAAQAARLRQRLVGEFDHPRPDAALALAKLYIAAGLGAEAALVIDLFAGDDPTGLMHREIAGLLVGDPAPAGGSLLRPDCTGDQALWRALAHAVSGDDAAAVRDEAASGRALERLPASLRELAGAPIGLAASRAGDWEGARRIEALIGRSPVPLGHGAGPRHLLAARLADRLGDIDRAKKSLRAARRTDPESAALALLDLAGRALHEKEFPVIAAAGLRLDLGTLARLGKGTELGAAAFGLEVRLLERGRSRDEAVALASYGVSAGLLPAEQYPTLVADLAAPALPGAESRPLALSYLDDPDRYAPALEHVAFREALIASLSDTGLPALAVPMLRESDRKDASLMLGLAEALLEGGDPRQAIEMATATPPSSRRDRILGAALLASGQAEEAVALLTSGIDDDAGQDRGTAALRRQLGMAMRSDQHAAALQLAETLLARAPDAATAETLAILSLRMGADAMPESVAAALRATAPERLAALDRLFAGPIDESRAEEPEAVSAYLEALEAEIALIGEMLADG